MIQPHTPEPWQAHQDASGDVFISSAATSLHIAEIGSEDDDTAIPDARRIVACVNACAGIPTDILESSAKNMLELSAARANCAKWAGEAAQAKQQRDELLAALEEVHRIASGSNMTHNMMVIRDRCADAIAKFKVKGDAT